MAIAVRKSRFPTIKCGRAFFVSGVKMEDDDLGTTRWFGLSWDAPVCDERTHIPVPTGETCTGLCNQPIKEDDQGIRIPHWDGYTSSWTYYHLDCWLEAVLGPGYERLI